VSRSAWGLDTIVNDRDWLPAASCGPDVAEWFWITSKGHIRLSDDNRGALSICRKCPVLRECDADATANPMPWPHISGGAVRGLRK
jgi:hypothetical protein